jgi:hypothetical protein
MKKIIVKEEIIELAHRWKYNYIVYENNEEVFDISFGSKLSNYKEKIKKYYLDEITYDELLKSDY